MPSPTPTLAARIATFRQLHASGCFVMPNPWDVGSARLLATLGFPAVATTSSGLAWSRGEHDNQVGLDDTLAYMRAIAEAVDLPVNADFEGGFAVEPHAVAEHVTLATGTGVAGLSIEDSTGDAQAPLYDRALAVERVRAAREAIDASGTGVLLTGRSEGFICGRPDLPETIARLVAYADAGADCVYAPGIKTEEQIAAIVQAVAPVPVNLLVNGPFVTVERAAALGVRRISVGGALARSAWAAMLQASREMLQQGTFTALGAAISTPDLERLLPPR